MMTTSLSTSYPAVFLAQGICTGLGEGMTYVPALAVISTHFTTKRPIAIGVASLGSSVGGVIFPIMFRKLQPSIGFPWAVRAIAFINLALALLTLAILFRHRPPPTPAPRPLLDLKALRSLPFNLFALSLFLLFTAYYVPLFYIVTFARTALHESTSSSFDLLAITNASSFLGRTVPYLLGPRVKPIYTLLLWSFIGAVLLFSWPAIHSPAGFIIWCVVWGCVAGVLVTAPTSTIAHPVMSPSLSVIGTRMGMLWSFAAVGALVGAPIAGALADAKTASFLHTQMFAGAVMVGGVACLVWPLVAMERVDRGRAKAKAREGARG
jgi:MFS family permease